MDQSKIGKFITECRKKKNLTQAQLAEKLNLTNRAISKWETGKAMPDSDIMLALCDILEISVNELLCGEKMDAEQKNDQTSELIFQMAKNEERYHKRLRSSAHSRDQPDCTCLSGHYNITPDSRMWISTLFDRRICPAVHTALPDCP